MQLLRGDSPFSSAYSEDKKCVALFISNSYDDLVNTCKVTRSVGCTNDVFVIVLARLNSGLSVQSGAEL